MFSTDEQSAAASGTDDSDSSESRRVGRPAEGLYPHISRTDLAATLGYGKSAISWMLRGRLRIDRLSVAIPMAAAVGVTVEQLQRDWQAERDRYEEQRWARVRAREKAKKGKRRKRGKTT